jgi:hypothetical protein
VLIDACLASRPRLVGCDFGVPRTAGEQARKIILIEAVKLADRHYAIEPNGRNARLIQTHGAGNSWKARRRGWTLPELLLSLGADASVELAAFDFPFSLPVSLLRDEAFARPMNQPPFGTRNAWVSFVKSRMNLFFEDDSPNAPLRDLDTFQRWKEKRFWQKRVTDVATNGSPPLKHLFQNVFAMTIAGAAFLGGLEESGYAVLLDSARPTSRQSVFETYPRAVARRAGFAGSYKALPRDCMDHTIRFMSERGIRIDVDPGVRNFCETYRTAGNDPDGADAFLCLIAAICCAEGLAELCGHADAATLREEGAVIAPIISR